MSRRSRPHHQLPRLTVLAVSIAATVACGDFVKKDSPDGGAGQPDANLEGLDAAPPQIDAAVDEEFGLTALSNSAFEELQPSVSPDVSEYRLDLSLLSQEIRLTATASAGATLLIEGSAATSGEASVPIPLSLGEQELTIEVLGDGGASRSYTITVDRGGIDPTQEAYAKASNGEAGDKLGNLFQQVAIDGDLMAVGTSLEGSSSRGINGPEDDNDSPASGAVYVFRKAAGSWQQEAYIKASNADPSDEFGTTLVLQGDTLVVGAPAEDSASGAVDGDETSNAASNSGAAYVFRRQADGSWVQEAYLKQPTPQDDTGFGRGLAIDGDTVAVGSPSENAVHTYVRTGSTWSYESTLAGDNTVFNDQFGISISLDGDMMAVGAHTEDSGNAGVNADGSDNSVSSSGAVYVFIRTGSTWNQDAYLKSSNPGPGDQLGECLSLSNNILVAGAHHEDSNATGVDGDGSDNSADVAGAAYIFERKKGLWSQTAYLKGAHNERGDTFGRSVSVIGDLVAVTALGEDSSATGANGAQDNNDSSGSGAVFLYRKEGTSWIQAGYLKASNTDPDDHFGTSVALSKGGIAIGAADEDSNSSGVNGDQGDNSAEATGAVYVFH